MNESVKYTIDDLLGDSPLVRALNEPNPGFQSVYENAVAPQNLSAGGLVGNLVMQDGYMKSSNFDAGVSGWQIKADGSAEFSNIRIRGSANTVTFPSYQPIDGTTTPVPVILLPNGQILIADANDADLDDFIGFVKEDYSTQTPAVFLNDGGSFTGASGSVTANAGIDRIMIVWISQNDGGTPTVPSAVTWGAISLTKFSDTTQGTNNVSGWVGILGTSTSNQTNTLSLTGSTGGEVTLSSIYQYANQSSPVGTAQTAIAGASSGSIGVSITPTQSYSLIASAGSMDGTITLDAVMTTRASDSGSGGQDIESGDGYYTGLSAVTVTHTVSPNSTNRTIHAVEIMNSVSTDVDVIVLGTVNGFTGLTVSSDYYLSDTVGTISTTPGSTSVLVGKAISATSLLIING